ncbi:hypothetical protein AB0M02_12145 [Actinoplanes sp. NPDC051861]|uniref:hypothetical protein n=1 Tax=Actinoplanes sp. NPDC051861 TaxID=3155170 RepID=UPI0034447E6C
MRLPRFLLAGVLLFAAVLLLTALFAQPPFHHAGAVAFAVFTPLWLTVTVVNAALGVFSAGYRPREEALVALPVFGVPALVAGLAWWFAGDRLITSARLPFLLLAGVCLWAAIALLAALMVPSGALHFAAAVFVPLWTMLMIANLLIGVVVADYSVAEELPILFLNLVPPLLPALAAPTLTRRLPTRRS